jgi:hypothetical protein
MKMPLSCLIACVAAGVLSLQICPPAASAAPVQQAAPGNAAPASHSGLAKPTTPAAFDRAAFDRPTFDRARFFPAKGHEQAMLHGRFCGSNRSARDGFEVLAQITSVPEAGKWTELSFRNAKPYRWIRYEAPPGSSGRVAEMEFYFGKRKALGRTFGSFGWRSARNWPRAFDGKTDTWFESDSPDDQYLGLDVGDWATAQTPRLAPPPCDQREPLLLTLKCATPGAEIRYSFSGMPTRGEGTLYTQPIRIEHTTTIFAVSFKPGLPPSPVASGTYIVGEAAKQGPHTLHVGNSLTGSTLRLADYARTAGYLHDYRALLKDSGQTVFAWNGIQSKNREAWEKLLAEMPTVDHFTVQPRPPHFGDQDRAEEAKYDVLFFNAVRARFPQVQPWIYAEWPGRKANDRSSGWPPILEGQTNGSQTSGGQTSELVPASTFEEAASAMLMHVEGIQQKVLEQYTVGKRPRILPCVLAVARLKNLLDAGAFAGLSASDLDRLMFYDNVHPGDVCRYMLCLTWFAAFYGQSPEGTVAPVAIELTPAQTTVMQRMAWDVVKNYPDCGLYETGATPCGRPEFSIAAEKAAGTSRVTLTSATPGAWFRYTLDGTAPSRTRGYVYCGVVSLHPGTTLKAVAYKSGMADSAIASIRGSLLEK